MATLKYRDPDTGEWKYVDNGSGGDKDYVDAQDALKVNKAGDEMTGALTLNGGDLYAADGTTRMAFWSDGALLPTAVATPTAANQAATKGYVDGGAWTAVQGILGSGWTAHTWTPQYRVAAGRVYFRGLVAYSGGTPPANSVIITVPANLRPPTVGANAGPHVSAPSTQGSTVMNTVIGLNSDGTVTLKVAASAAVTWLSLDSLQWALS